MAAVLITVSNGTVDYCTDGDTDLQVVMIDVDRHDLDTSFPDDVDLDIKALRQLPSDMPWVREMIRRLCSIRTQIQDHIRSQAPPADDEPDLFDTEGE